MKTENKVRIALAIPLAILVAYEFPWIIARPLYELLGHLVSLTAVMAALCIAAYTALSKRGRRLVKSRGRLIVLVAAILLLAATAAASEAARSLYVAKSVEVVEIDSLPSINPRSFRVVPLAVARYWAEASFTSPTHRPGDNVLLGYVNGTPVWQIPIVPDGAVNYYRRRMTGYIEIPANTFNPERTIVRAEFKYGYQHFHGLEWAAYIKAGLWGEKPEPGDAFISRHNGENWIIIPVTGWRVEGIFTLPALKHVLLVSEKGDIEVLTPSQALSDPRTRGAPLIPEWMARWYVEKLNLRRGLLNTITYHKDMFQLTDPSSYNKQPWLLLDSNGTLWWVFAAEPYGRGGGVNRIFLVNARSPEIRIYEYRAPQGLLLMGPRRAVDQAKASLPTYDWERFTAEEPIPFIANNTLYWRIAVIPKEASRIDKLIIVNAENGETTPIPGDQELYSFLAGQRPGAGGGQHATPIQRLENLEEAIREEIERLQQLLREIEELKRQLTNTTQP